MEHVLKAGISREGIIEVELKRAGRVADLLRDIVAIC
jgi:hypothetical protein